MEIDKIVFTETEKGSKSTKNATATKVGLKKEIKVSE